MKRDLSFYTTASQNLITVHHIKSLLACLQKEGPEVLFFRGASLLGDVYPSLGDRSMLDVDILVRERDLSRLKKVLKGMGLEENEPGVFGRIGLLLDVHTSFLTPIRTALANSNLTISMDEVFQRSITKRLDDIEISIPCPEHLFISTAFHLQSHSFFWDKGWEDLIRIKQYYDLSNETVFSEAQRMGAERSLYYLSYLRPELFPSWTQRLTWGERWILHRIKGGRYNQNFGDLLFLFQSKNKGKALQEIFFSQGISFRIIGDRLRKCLLLVKDFLSGSRMLT
jgi:hypothetical protein